MRNKINILFLFGLLTFSFACADKNTAENANKIPEQTANAKVDTLQFTSGIRTIFQDRHGHYWFGSRNEGVSYYNGKSFQYFTIKDGLSDNQIRSIQEDVLGNIWIGTANGVNVFKQGIITTYSTDTNHPITAWSETQGDLWFYADEEKGINRFDGNHLNYLLFPQAKNKPTDNSYGVTDISKHPNGSIWIATYAALFHYDGKMVKRYDQEKLKLKDNELLHIRSVLADSKGRVWIGNNGIGVLLLEGDSITRFSEHHHLIHPTSKRNGDLSKPGTLEHVFATAEDVSGNIWFGDRDTGAWKYDGEMMTNMSIGDPSKRPMIWTIYRDNENNLLFGMEDGSVLKFNGMEFEKMF